MRQGLLYALRCWLLCSLLSGCADLPVPPAEPVRSGWGTLVIVPAQYPPKSNILSFAVGKGAGAAKGAAAGTAVGLAGAGMFAAGGPFAVVLAPYLAVAMATGMGAAGAYGGSQAAISEQDAAAMDAHIQRNLAILEVPGTLARAIEDTLTQDTGRQLPLLAEAGPTMPESKPDYRALAQQGADSVLEVVVSEVGFIGEHTQMQFYLQATIRVVRVSDDSPLYQREFVYQSDEYEAQRWGENQAALFEAELQRAYASLAESAVEQVFLLTPLQLESKASTSGEASLKDLLGGQAACGLAWVSPAHDYQLDFWGDVHHRNMHRFPIVASRQPTLAWEAFPRKQDRGTDARAGLSGLSNVRYDLRVWQVLDNAPPRLIYQRRDLPASSHTLEQPLAPQSRYFWSARARFDLAGAVHSTKWGCFRAPYYLAGSIRDRIKPDPSPGAVIGPFLAGVAPRDVCTLDFIPTRNYYRFQTP